MKTRNVCARMRRLVIAAILGPLTFGCAAVCVAGDGDEAPRALVKVGDLNLSSRDGAVALYRRIYAAAYEVCKYDDIDSRDLSNPAARDECVRLTVRAAVAKVNQPALFSVYNAGRRIPLPATLASQRP